MWLTLLCVFSVWDQFQQSQFNWLWWECVTFQHYAEETSYENSLLVQQTGALALSSLTHVLRSLTPNARYRINPCLIICQCFYWHSVIFYFLCFSICRGIFKLLVNFQLENKDNPSYTGAQILKITTCYKKYDLNSLILTFFFFCVQVSLFKISTSDVEKRSW